MDRLKVLAVIPARLGSTRLQNKPLIQVKGKPIVQYVYENLRSPLIDQKIVATDSKEIMKVVESFGGKAMMTSPDHQNGTERCVEVLTHYNDYDVILNIQGDEPLVNQNIIEKLIIPFQNDSELKITTLKKIMLSEEISNPNVVKVVTDKNQHALYFSRSAIPFDRDGQGESIMKNFNDTTCYWKHLGFYGFKVSYIEEYLNYPPCYLEELEKLEQLRVLYHGEKIFVNEVTDELIDINTAEDLAKYETYLNEHS